MEMCVSHSSGGRVGREGPSEGLREAPAPGLSPWLADDRLLVCSLCPCLCPNLLPPIRTPVMLGQGPLLTSV